MISLRLAEGVKVVCLTMVWVLGTSTLLALVKAGGKGEVASAYAVLDFFLFFPIY